MTSRARWQGRLRFRSLLLLVVLAAVLPLFALTAIVLARLFADGREATEARLLQSARDQSALIEREFGATVRTLQALAQSDRLDSGPLSAFDAEARRAVATQPTWLGVNLTSPDGVQHVNTRHAAGAPLPAILHRESFERVLATRAPVVGALLRDRPGGLALAIRVPVERGGVLRGVMSAIISAAALEELIATRLPADREWTRTIVDTAGTIAARTRSPEQFVGTPATPRFVERTGRLEGVHRDVTVDGEEVYVAHRRGATYDWTSAVVVPVAVLDGPFRQSMAALAVATMLALAFGAGCAFVLARRMSRDFSAAAGAAEALARGERPSLGAALVDEVARLDEALDHSAALLERRQRERDEHLAHAESARREAEAANRAKDEFLAMLGHELRNPLSPIVTALQLLKLRGERWGREHAIIERQVQHMTRLVDDLLDTSRITRGKIELKQEPVELQAIVGRAVEITQPLFETMRHRLDVDVPADGCVVLGDPVRLAQVVANLLSNAARYTPPGGHVRVSCRRENGEVALEVIDNGQGIGPALLPHVFEPFVQSPRASDRREGGLGLGLALVKSLVQLHGGRVAATSDGPGHGSTFRITLPASLQPVMRPAEGGAPLARRSGSRRILVVDDNIDAADMLASVLAEEGHLVTVAHDGPTALQLVEGYLPEVAIVDIGLPVMDGYELAARLREQLGSRAPLFVAVTGYGQVHDHARSESAGFAGHLVKPVNTAELHALIERLPADSDASLA